MLVSTPLIFALEPDDNARPLLKYNLQTWGYQVIIAFDETDALQRCQSCQEHYDLILINQVGRTIAAWIALGVQIRQEFEANDHTPILVMAEQYVAELEGQDLQVGDNEYVSYLEDGQQLKAMLQRLCPV